MTSLLARRSATIVMALGLCLIGGAGDVLAAVRYNGKALRDPFSDPAANAPKTDADQMENAYKSLVLQGILYNVENPRAIINNKIVGAGDRVVGLASVAAIHRSDVVLSVNGKTITLKQTIRKTSDDTEPKEAIKKN